MHRVFNLWKGSPGSAAESKAAYAAYHGGDFIDVGAYEGFYSMLLAPKAGPGAKFLALEPDRRFFAKLIGYLGELKNLFPDIQFHPLPLACGDGTPSAVSCTSGIARLETRTVDELAAFLDLRPSFVKIDVEGHEFAVLQGMRKTLGKFHPVIMLETHPKYLPSGVSVQDVADLLRQHGYAATDLDITNLAWRQIWRVSPQT